MDWVQRVKAHKKKGFFGRYTAEETGVCSLASLQPLVDLEHHRERDVLPPVAGLQHHIATCWSRMALPQLLLKIIISFAMEILLGYTISNEDALMQENAN